MTQWKRSHLVICGLYLGDISEISIKFCMKSANGNPAYLKPTMRDMSLLDSV